MEIDIRDISKEITNALRTYTREVTEGLEEAKVKVAKKAVKKLKSVSRERTGKYAAGWARKKIGSGQIIYNKNKPQITHLLEHGHILRDGGRAQAFPHIKPAETEAIKEFTKEVEKVIKG